MAITELYGIRITDRITITEIGRRQFQVFFDGAYLCTETSGTAAVQAAKDWLAARQRQREAEDDRAEAEAKREQEIADNNFLYRVFPQLDHDDLDTLLAVLKRRLAADV